MAGLEQDNRTEHARKLSPPGLVNSFLRNRSTSEAFKKLFVSFLLTVDEKLFSKCFYFTVSTFRSHGVDLVQNAAGLISGHMRTDGYPKTDLLSKL